MTLEVKYQRYLSVITHIPVRSNDKTEKRGSLVRQKSFRKLLFCSSQTSNMMGGKKTNKLCLPITDSRKKAECSIRI